MYKACSRCGKIHDINYKCNANKVYTDTQERSLRNQRRWKEKSNQIRDMSNYLCEVCRDEGQINYTDIQVHHITKLRDDPSLYLDDSNLIALCPVHHREADAGRLSKEYLFFLAEKRGGYPNNSTERESIK